MGGALARTFGGYLSDLGFTKGTKRNNTLGCERSGSRGLLSTTTLHRGGGLEDGERVTIAPTRKGIGERTLFYNMECSSQLTTDMCLGQS